MCKTNSTFSRIKPTFIVINVVVFTYSFLFFLYFRDLWLEQTITSMIMKLVLFETVFGPWGAYSFHLLSGTAVWALIASSVEISWNCLCLRTVAGFQRRGRHYATLCSQWGSCVPCSERDARSGTSVQPGASKPARPAKVSAAVPIRGTHQAEWCRDPHHLCHQLQEHVYRG